METKQTNVANSETNCLTSSNSKSNNSLTRCVSNILHKGFSKKRSESEQGSNSCIRKDGRNSKSLMQSEYKCTTTAPAFSSKGAPASTLTIATPQKIPSPSLDETNDNNFFHSQHNCTKRRRNTVFFPSTPSIDGVKTPTSPSGLFHYSRRLSVDHATMGNILGRIMFVEERQVMFLNFENLKIESIKHLENIAACIRMLVKTSMESKRKDGQFDGKIKCFLNDDDLDCDSHLFDTYTQTVHMNPLFETVTRYTNKSLFSDHQRKIQKSLRDCEVYVKTCPCILDRYVFMVDDQIGKGTYGTVSLAMDLSLGRKVAVKRLCKKTVKLIGIEEYVQNEMEIMKLLRDNPHENIVQVLDIHESEAEYLFVMEYLSGGCLDNPFDEFEIIPESQAQLYFCQLVDAVDHLHSKLKVLHRDIQPSNCCFLDTEKKWLKLVDFGLSCQPTDFTKKEHTLFCGNSNYACPELLLKKAYGSEVDVYALGVLLYKILFGCFPFRGAQQKLLMHFTVPLKDDVNGDDAMGSDDCGQNISKCCKDLLHNILEVNCEKRFSIQDIKNHQWYKIGKTQKVDLLESHE
ncbi:predicted protein [Naegleria gruberi]|uniref:Predicted protein n=1 Tax=Naegleria gruberi TaxID=5762 RepID=D2W1N3_NAEGR|nr:uncharacterized protein NAEGRDRAFT_75316 [Naegleria gruberi]EFC36951.1 predicted protein [Naegleria gruberi]|eukprot:XP_002669695.1 predicted protein [Naegleria gruberi strain NEG-M]